MSRNPYLAASRPTSSFTRSSRTSKRSDLSSGRAGLGGGGGGLLGRSRSSATLGGFSSQFGQPTTSSYSSASNYIPSSSTSTSWQPRSASSTRLSGSTRSSTSNELQANAANDQRVSPRYDSPRSLSLNRSSSTHSFASHNDDPGGQDDDADTSHLKNYQQSKLKQQQQRQQLQTPSSRIRSSLQSLDSDGNSTNDYTKRSTTSLDSTATDATSNDEPIGDSIPSGSARHLTKSPGQLAKSQSLDISRQQQQDADSPILTSSMSVDRLLLRAESMGERDLRKSFKELVMENERLKRQLVGFDEKDKQRQQEWIRKERQLQRKISELEEENKQLENWKLEIQRLKEENNSLIRVVSKLSKQ